MAYENVKFAYNNFCIAPTAGNFCSVDTTNVNALLRFKNSSGDDITSYTFNPNISQGTEIKSLEYSGPKTSLAVAQLGNELPFFTLEHNSSTQCTIRRWKLSTTNARLELDKTIVKSTAGSYYFDCYDMAIEYYHTEFDGATATGTGYITVDSVGKMEVGDKLLLGPSSDMDNQYAFEWVEITSINGSDVYITASGVVPPQNEYDNANPITYYKNIFLFSDIGQNNDSTKGSLYKIDPNDGSVLSVQDGGLYADVRSSAWSSAYQCVGMIKGSNLLYIDPNDNYEVKKSHALTNIEDDDATIIPIYDLIFDSTTIYRLQQKTTLRDDSGDKTTTDWTTYNYHRDTTSPYTKSISLAVDPDGIVINNDQVTITAVVRDQFGVGLLSQDVYFEKSGGDPNGNFDPNTPAMVTTNASGIATIIYDVGDYDISGTNAEVNIKAKTDGASTLTGSQYVWDNVSLFLYSNFTTDLINITQKPTLSGPWPTEGSDLYTQIYMTQVSGMKNEFNVKQLSKFQFPGGAWEGISAPSSEATSVRQLLAQENELKLDQINDEFNNETSIFQNKELSNDLQLSQTYVSRHLTSGHKDDVDIDQFKFIEDAVPAFWSEKNPTNTNIWIRLRPFADSLDQNSLIFRVKEISYAGDTDYTDVASLCTVTPFDAGGGLQGLDILYDPSNDFHHNGIVYVSIEVYDNASIPNIILIDYWFKIIPDYKAPYIVNENPAREEEDVATNTNISFDILDAGVGVDINTLELHVNARRIQTHSISAISGGYHISYNPSKDFNYGETVEITIKIRDASDYENMLYDMWRFYIAGSTGPWIDRGSFDPRNCAKGVYRKRTGISFNVYDINDTGVDQESMLVTIGGRERNVNIVPIIYRQE